MSENTGLKSLYSVFIFLLAFSIINFYARKVKEEKRWKMENQKIIDAKAFESFKEAELKLKAQRQFWDKISQCNDFHQFLCGRWEIFLLHFDIQ